jgi:hypothetical protein
MTYLTVPPKWQGIPRVEELRLLLPTYSDAECRAKWQEYAKLPAKGVLDIVCTDLVERELKHRGIALPRPTNREG